MESNTVNLTNICRTCKCVAPQMHPLFHKYESPRIDEMLMACTYVLALRDDGLPDQICQTCLERLKNAFDFKLQAERIDAYLRERAKHVEIKEIKQEPQNWDLTENEIKPFPSEVKTEGTFDTAKNASEAEMSSNTKLPDVTAKTHENGDEYKGFFCPVCQDMFGTMSAFAEHAVVHERENLDHTVNRDGDTVTSEYSDTEDGTNVTDNEIELAEVKLEDICDIEENIQEADSVFHIKSDVVDLGKLRNGSVATAVKRGRGRPRKNPSKPARKARRGRGRPPVTKENEGKKCHNQCGVCEETFPSKPDLVEHRKSHNIPIKEFVCTECGRRFSRNDYLLVHMRRHRGEKPFKCKFCGKGFTRTTDVTAHERCHTGEKTHLCSICGRGFGRAYNLTLHIRTHTGERPYQCSQCTAAFAQCNDLKVHVRRVHTGERFRCELCNDSFCVGYQLTHHKRVVHGQQLVPKLKLPDEPPPLIPLRIKPRAPVGCSKANRT